MPLKFLRRTDPIMKILFLLDPLEKLDPFWDSSLALAREFLSRGHSVWGADIPDLLWKELACEAMAGELALTGRVLRRKRAKKQSLHAFDLIVVRKEPPFDPGYLFMTYMLETLSSKVVISNDPAGIRNNNEKLSSLLFGKYLAPTLVSASAEAICRWQDRHRQEMVIKPLDQKGGDGIFRLKPHEKNRVKKLINAQQNGSPVLMAQHYLKGPRLRSDKRVLVLGEKIIGCYEKRFAPGDFRGNMSQGARLHAATLSSSEKKLVRDLVPYLISQGIDLAGLDIMAGKLIEINVTCPGGLTEAQALYPGLKLIEVWADYLEKRVERFRASSPSAGQRRDGAALAP